MFSTPDLITQRLSVSRHSEEHTMLAAGRYTCASLLLALAAAEWVEISQHRYRKPLPPARSHSHPLPDQPPTKHSTDLLVPVQHPFLNHNAQNPTNYQDVSRNTYVYHDEPLEDPTSVERVLAPQTDRLNPFKDNSEMRNTYDYGHVSKNKYYLTDNKKPMRNDFSIVDDLFLVPTSETYANHTQNNWYQNIRHQSNVRSDIELVSKEPTYLTKNNQLLQNDRTDRTDERSKYAEVDIDKETIKILKEDHGSNSGKVERVSNIGNVKRVNLANTPVKSPTVKLNKNSESRNDESTNVDDFSDELDLENNVFKNTRVDKVSFNLEKVSNNSETVGQINITITHGDTLEKDKAMIETTETVLNIMNGHNFTPKLEMVTTEATTDNWRHHGASSVDKVKPKEKQTGANNGHIKLTENDPFVDKTERMQDKKEKLKTNGFKSNLNAYSDSVEYDNTDEEEGNKANLEKNSEKTSGEVKVNGVEKILKFVKVVAKTISKNTGRGGDRKITYLNQLKHSLLNNIKERIEAAWPEEAPRRHARAARGHVEFPSSESALMTISFLTFAVFLIKLVLQVIQTYKHKTMLMAPLMVATAGRTLSKKLRTNT